MKNLALLLLLTVCCSYCKSTKPMSISSTSTVSSKHISKHYGTELNGKWELQRLWGMDDKKLGKGYINLDFENKSFSGNAGCNDISGTFSIKDDLLIIDKNIQIAKNECPAYNDKKFISLLMKINKYEVNDDVLELSQDNIVLMSFKRMQ